MIILSRRVLPVTKPPIDNGGVVVSGSKIAAVGSAKSLTRMYPRDKVLDLGDRLLMPGLVNLHTHVELSYLEGQLAEHEEFFGWIHDLIETRRRLNGKGMARYAKVALSEITSTGTTCIADISTTDAAIPHIIKSGLRASVFLEVIGLDPDAADSTIERLDTRFKELSSVVPGRIRLGVSPHAPYSVSDNLFNILKAFVSTKGLDISIHLLETADELSHFKDMPSGMDDYFKRYGWDLYPRDRSGSPLRLLKKFGLDRRALVVHAVHVTKGDILSLHKSGASVATCPRSNHYLKVGKAPVEELIAAGVNVGIGTDSLASNIDLDLWEEMRFAYLVHKLTARQVIEMATVNGARALGLEGVIGGIEPGMEADLIAVDGPAARHRDPYTALIRETRRGDIAFSMVQGKVIHSSY